VELCARYSGEEPKATKDGQQIYVAACRALGGETQSKITGLRKNVIIELVEKVNIDRILPAVAKV
jgi:hypothetical protein